MTVRLVVLFLLFLEEEMEAPRNANDFIEVSAAAKLHGWGSEAGVRPAGGKAWAVPTAWGCVKGEPRLDP